MQNTDATTIRDWKPVEGVWAAFALPFPPFFAGLPLLFWALMERGEGHEIAGLISVDGRIVPVWDSPKGEFVDYYRPGQQPENDIQELFLRVQQQGEALYREMFPDARAKRVLPSRESLIEKYADVLPTDDDDDEDEEVLEPVRRPRKRSNRSRHLPEE